MTPVTVPRARGFEGKQKLTKAQALAAVAPAGPGGNRTGERGEREGVPGTAAATLTVRVDISADGGRRGPRATAFGER
jgi:hypothetical protein